MGSSGSPDPAAGGLSGFVLRAVAPLVAGAAVLEVTAPPVRLVPPGFWTSADTPRRHRREAPGTDLGGETFDLALVRGAPGLSGDEQRLRAVAGALRPAATVLLFAPPDLPRRYGPDGPRPDLAAVLASAGMREVCQVAAADVVGVPEDAGTVHVLRAGLSEAEGHSGGSGQPAVVRDAGLTCLMAAAVADARVRSDLAAVREESAIEITKLTTTLDARTVSLTRRVERADRTARRWEQRYDQLRNRPALRAAAAVEGAVTRLRRRVGRGTPPGAAAPGGTEGGHH